ncbi:hypothetical protein [Sphingomonas endolithica]|uniref:hypothetical protein n=1 Tax=Sphingomonas endolithica TaxID=2972485 RepID=UPI0021AFFF9E|nr:hypothetical protein [Sphingomonas sp. ZFBP2030]
MLFGLQSAAALDPAQVAAAKDRLQHRMERDPRVTTMHPGGLATLPDGTATPPQSLPGAFQWGEGGQRMTPDEIASRRSLAQQQMAAGMDFSPVGHWTQGMARVAQALVGSLEARKLDKASEANAAQNRSIASLLTGGNATAADAAAAAVDPYASEDTRKLGMLQYQRLTPKPQEPSDLQQRVEYLDKFKPGLGRDYASNYAANGGMAPQVITTPQGTFMVPRSPSPVAAPAAGGGIPDAALSFLRQNPGSAAQFDAKYGEGASTRVLQGGAAPQAPSPFVTQ